MKNNRDIYTKLQNIISNPYSQNQFFNDSIEQKPSKSIYISIIIAMQDHSSKSKAN